MEAFLTEAESKLKSWIVKYGRQECVEEMLRDYVVSLESIVLSIPFCSKVWIYKLFLYLVSASFSWRSSISLKITKPCTRH